MATNFEPVGVRAVVEGAEKFVQDLSRMRRAVLEFVQLSTAYGTSATQLGQASQQASQGNNAYAVSATHAAAVADLFSQAVVRNTNNMQNYGVILGTSQQQVTQLGEKLAFLTVKNIENLNATTRAIAGNKRLSQSLIELTASKTKLQEQLGALSQKWNILYEAEAKLSNKGVELSQSIKKTETSITQLGGKIQVTNTNIKAQDQVIASLQGKLDRLDPSLKETSSEYQALDARVLKAHAAHQRLVNTLNETQAKLDSERGSLNALQQEFNEVSAESQQMAQSMDRVEQEAQQVEAAIGQIDGKIGTITKLGAALGAAQVAFGKAATAAKLFANAVAAPQKLTLGLFRKLEEINASANKFANNMFKMGNSIRFYGMSLVFLISIPIIGFLGGLTKAAIDFEEAFAGVIKTVEGLVKEGTLNELNEDGIALQRAFRSMALEIPISASGLADLGQIAGQLGVRGVGNIETFVDTIARVGASTDLAQEDAARMMAQIIAINGPLTKAEANLAGLTDAQYAAASSSELFQVQVQAMGSTIVNLGNKLPTTEENISRFASRIAAAGGLAKFTAADIFGIAAAFASVGIPAERGGTAVQRTIIKMLEAVQVGGDSLKIFAKVAGVSADEFANAFKEGGEKAGDIFNQFVTGLGQNAEQAILILDELDLADQRVLNSLLSLANASDQAGNENNRLNESLEIAREGYRKNGDALDDYNALQLESERRFATTQSQIILMKNALNDLQITMGSALLPALRSVIDHVRSLARRFEEFARSPGGQQFIKIAAAVGLAVASIGPFVIALGLLMSTIGFIGLAITKVIGIFLLFGSTLGLLFFPITAVIIALGGLAVAFVATLANIAKTTKNGISSLTQKMWEFGRGLILAFAKGMATALGYVVQVLIAIGKIISNWLKPGSPPKIVPDLDKWGAEAMTVYLKGWLSGDFSVFNQISDKIEGYIRSIKRKVGEEELIPNILGTREAIAKAINQVKQIGKVTKQAIDLIVKSVPNATSAVREYAEALLELQVIQKKYSDSLEPLNKRLQEIADRQKEVSKEMRKAELEEILADPRATELVRELAGLELEQIGLQDEVDAVEKARDAELAIAEERLKVAEETLNFQVKQNQLIEEYLQTLEQLEEKAKETGSDISGLLDEISGFEPPDLEGDLTNVLGEIDSGIQETIDNIGEQFSLLVLDLKAIFQPLIDDFNELGEVWRPIFEALGEAIGGIIGVNPFADWTLPSEVAELESKFAAIEEHAGGIAGITLKGFLPKDLDPSELSLEGTLATLPPLLTDQHFEGVRQFGTDVQNLLDGPLTSIAGFLIDIGLIEPFGKFEETLADMQKQARIVDEEPFFTSFGEKVSGIVDKLSGIKTETIANLSEIINKVAEAIRNFSGTEEGEGPGAVLAGIIEKVGNFIEKVRPIADFISKIAGKILKFQEAIGGVGLSFLENLPLDDLKTSFQGFIDAVRPGLERLFEAIGLGEGADGIMKQIISGIGQFIQFLPQILDLVSSIAASGLLQGLIRAIQLVLPFLGSFLSAIFTTIGGVVNIFKASWEILWGIIQTLVGAITGNFDLLQAGADTLTSAFEHLVQGIMQIVQGFVEGFGSLIAGFVTLIVGFFLGLVEGIINAFKSLVQFLPESMQGTVGAILDIVGGFVTSLIEKVSGLIDSVIEWFQTLYDKLIGHSIVTDMISDITAAFTGWIPDLIAKAGEIVGAIVDTIAELPGKLLDIGKNAIQALGDGIKNFASAPIDAIGGAVSGVLGKVGGLLGLGSPSKEFIDIGEDIMTGWAGGLSSNIQLVLTIFEEAGAKILAIAEKIQQLVPERFANMMQLISQVVTTFAPQIVAAFQSLDEVLSREFSSIGENMVGEWASSLSSNVSVVLDIFVEAGTQILTIAEGIQAKVPGYFAKMMELIAKVVSQYTPAILDSFLSLGKVLTKEFADIGETLIKKWADGLSRNVKLVFVIFTDAGKTIIDIVEVVQKEVPRLFVSMLELVARIVAQQTVIVFELFVKFGMLLTDLLKTISEEIVGIPGRSIWNVMFENMIDVFSQFKVLMFGDEALDLLKRFQKLLQDMQNAINASRQGFNSAGQNIMDGLIAGMESRRAAVIATAASIARAAEQAANDAAQNGSPSRVFEGIGKNMMLGWEVGILDNASRISDAIRSAIPAAKQAASRQAALASAGTTRAAPVSAPSVTGFGGTTNNVDIDMGGQTITNGIDAFELQLLIEQALRRAIG